MFFARLILDNHLNTFDKHSKFFFTTDGTMLGNREIIRLEKRLRDNGMRETDLKIQDGLPDRTA